MSETQRKVAALAGAADAPLPLRILTLNSPRGRLPTMKLADFPKLRQLPARQKLRLAEELWDDGVNDESLPVPPWHKELLSERMAAFKAGKLKTISTPELKRRLGVK